MKKVLVVLGIVAILIFLVAASSPGIHGKPSDMAIVKTSTPGPSGQINIPGMNIKLYIAGPNPLLNTPDSHGRVAGFVPGLFQGLISPGTLIVSFFNPSIQAYEVHNNGGFYNLGFILGAAVIFGFLGIAGGRRW